MSKRKARPAKARPAASRPRNRKVLAIIGGTAAVAVLAVVLVVANAGAPNGDVVAMVNGQRIAVQDVEDMQIRYRILYGKDIGFLQALNRLISDELIYQASMPDYLVDSEQAEKELQAQLERDGLTLEELKVELALNGIVYGEYLETFRRELAIERYLDDAVTVTEEEARERYDEYAESPGMALRPFEEVKYQIIIDITQEKIVSLIRDLEEEADIVRYTNSE